ncbi:MAG: sigma-70 family RNA polymerase sigma factor [Pseudomonadota bacterium]
MSFEQLYRQQYGQLLALATGIVRDLGRAEDLVQASFVKAMTRWPDARYPDHVNAWLVTVTRNAALDGIRHNTMQAGKLDEIVMEISNEQTGTGELDTDQHPAMSDDMLRLMFTCCHPALNIDARVALCLNTICGLKTEQIARAFVISDASMSQRLWRAKNKIRDAGIPYEMPAEDELQTRLQSVLAAIYLIFNEGWLASGEQHQRMELVNEALRLGQILTQTLQDDSEVRALLTLMVLQHSRRHARFSADGEIVLLADQDRLLWQTDEIQQATNALEQIFSSGHGQGRYALMAAIAATHCNAAHASLTNWNEIVVLYEALMTVDPSPVVALNHAVAVGERDGPTAGLRLVNGLKEVAMMQRYHLYYATRADFLRRLNQNSEAAQAYQQALDCSPGLAEQKLLRRRLAQMSS